MTQAINAESIERNQLYKDVREGKIPKRVPINLNMDGAAALEYAGFDLRSSQFNLENYATAFEKVAKDFESDNLSVTTVRFAHLYKLLGAKQYVMGAEGFIQHPEISVLEPEEYDLLIEDPYKCVWDIVIPRLYTEFNQPAPLSQIAFAKAYSTFFSSMGSVTAKKNEIAYKYGKSVVAGKFVQTDAPFDFIADLLRSFTGISKDIRRMPDKVVAACEAVLPLVYKHGANGTPETPGGCMIPLHMAPYMRTKDLEKFWWPTYRELVLNLCASNTHVSMFMEHDFSRYLDYFAEFEGCQMMAEFGDPKEFKKKLGKKNVLTGFYPTTLLKTGTKQQVIDKAKELIDIMAPGGRYIFSLDKSILSINDIKVENYQELLHFVKEYAVY